MARKPTRRPVVERQPLATRLEPAHAGWFQPFKARLAEAREHSRLPHALLIRGLPGSGQSALALWAAEFALCEAPNGRPCGRCGSCILFAAGNHPDLHELTVEEGDTYIKVDAIREFCGKLSMRSYRGGWKVGIIDPADRMNINSNNALLKTLEEPPEDTVILLPTSRTDRLARTVVSRCQTLHVTTPPADEALAWLKSQESRNDWPALLDLACGAPLLALDFARSGTAELAAEMSASMGSAGLRVFDPLELAETWSGDRPDERLAWLDRLLQAWIRAAAVSDAVNNNRDNALPSPPPHLNMKAAFGLLDRVREARTLQEGSINTLLLFEDLLVGFTEAFAGGSAVRPETQG